MICVLYINIYKQEQSDTHMKITGTKDIKAIIPGIGRVDKFGKAIDVLLSQIDLEITLQGASHFECFESNSGKQWKYVFSGNGLSSYCGQVSVKRASYGHATTPSGERAVDRWPERYRKVEDSIHDDVYDHEEIRPVTWGQVAKIIGSIAKSELTHMATCSKCGGSGRIDHFRHIENGLCFSCMGMGKWIELNKQEH